MTSRAANRAILTPDRRQIAISHRGPGFDIYDLFSGEVRSMSKVDYPTGHEPPPELGEGIMSIESGDRHAPEKFSGTKDEVIQLVRPDRGTRFATLDQGKRVIVWDLATGRGTFLVDNAKLVAISHTGDHVATQTEDAVQVWDLAAGKAIITETTHHTVSAFALGPRGMLVASFENAVVHFEPDKPSATMPFPRGRLLRSIAISSDGLTVIGGGDDGLVRRWKFSPTAEPWMDELIGHRGAVVALAFSPDESQIATAGADHEIRVWRLATKTSVLCGGHAMVAPILSFDDENTVVSAGLDRTTRVCDLRSGYSRSVGTARAEVVFAAHVGNGSRVVTVDRFHQLSEYPDNLPEGDLPLRAWLDGATNVRVDNPAN